MANNISFSASYSGLGKEHECFSSTRVLHLLVDMISTHDTMTKRVPTAAIFYTEPS